MHVRFRSGFVWSVVVVCTVPLRHINFKAPFLILNGPIKAGLIQADVCLVLILVYRLWLEPILICSGPFHPNGVFIRISGIPMAVSTAIGMKEKLYIWLVWASTISDFERNPTSKTKSCLV